MSAIYGILRFDGTDVAERDIERMGASMPMRAIDGHARFVDGPLGLGHSLLRETREDAFDQQPLYDRDARLVLTADLRLDNREDLAAALSIADDVLTDMPDSALLLRAYRAWGEACAERLIGDFAFAIWDVRVRRLVLGRDHMGQRYLHYHHGDGFFAFATEAKALLTLPGVPRLLDEGTLARRLCLDSHIANGETMFQGITGLAGGTTVAIGQDGGVQQRRYWSIAPDPAHLGKDEAYYIDTYRRVFAEAVACRVRRAAAPPGLLLSGGFDSAAIAGLSRSALPAGMKLRTVTSALPEGSNHHPKDARRGAECCQRDMAHIDHHWFVRTTETPIDDIEHWCHVCERAPTELNHIKQGMYAILARHGCRTIMDGIGGDETLNPRRSGALGRWVAQGRLLRFAREFRAMMRHQGISGSRLARYLARQMVPRPIRRLWRRWRYGPASVNPNFYIAADFADRMIAARTLSAPDLLTWAERRDEQAGQRELLTMLQSRARPDSALEAAAYGLSLTRPLLDKRVVEFALAIPADLHVVNGRMRHLARHALADILPIEFQARRSSQEYLDPAMGDSIDAMMPAIHGHVSRMLDHPRVRSYIDIDRLDQIAAADQSTLTARQKSFVLRSALMAFHIEWIDQNNRMPDRQSTS